MKIDNEKENFLLKKKKCNFSFALPSSPLNLFFPFGYITVANPMNLFWGGL